MIISESNGGYERGALQKMSPPQQNEYIADMKVLLTTLKLLKINCVH